ncbi:MAG: chromosomal replication initiator DnaA [Proteobacteria bacterium]|nr:chromosomal replication initiator DnaA [Pseudomonadota bacterium]
MTQQRLFEFRMGERSPETLVVTGANRDAARLLTEWRLWPGGALALIGPRGSGKTHLALAWALEAGARQVSSRAAAEDAASIFREASGRILVDNADQDADEAALWRVLDLARAEGGAVLMVGVQPPGAWSAAIPDLRSRLASMAVARLGEPDEALMEVVLRRVCREQFIHLSDDAARYLARRLPRTFAAAYALAAALDADLVKAARPVALPAARRALEKARAKWGDGDG